MNAPKMVRVKNLETIREGDTMLVDFKAFRTYIPVQLIVGITVGEFIRYTREEDGVVGIFRPEDKKAI